MPNQVNDATLRAQLHADIRAAWTGANAPTKIHDGRPRLPKKKADLPYAVLTLANVTQIRSGLKWNAQKYAYEITLVTAWPVGGNIEATKVARANELMAVLTVVPTYAGIGRERQITTIDFSEGENESLEPTLEVTITMEITVIDSH